MSISIVQLPVLRSDPIKRISKGGAETVCAVALADTELGECRLERRRHSDHDGTSSAATTATLLILAHGTATATAPAPRSSPASAMTLHAARHRLPRAFLARRKSAIFQPSFGSLAKTPLQLRHDTTDIQLTSHGPVRWAGATPRRRSQGGSQPRLVHRELPAPPRNPRVGLRGAGGLARGPKDVGERSSPESRAIPDDASRAGLSVPPTVARLPDGRDVGGFHPTESTSPGTVTTRCRRPIPPNSLRGSTSSPTSPCHEPPRFDWRTAGHDSHSETSRKFQSVHTNTCAAANSTTTPSTSQTFVTTGITTSSGSNSNR